ncbi:F-box only protein 15 isoform X1 [Amblyraja radiata]|uniref:F-box only protein 15 isoform X1 n=1 Tax=Amblyraja radiata TaxID=386614 RepID=UPI001403942D|nr:F-box only protein 15 isoform X1 [Amblyraja radiata]
MATGGGRAEVAKGRVNPRPRGLGVSARLTLQHGGSEQPGARLPALGHVCSSFGHKRGPSLLSRSYHGTKCGKLRSTSLTTVESLPWEVLLKIFTYLDVSCLLCAGCVSKRFYHMSNDNLIWHRIYCCYFVSKSKAWKPKAVGIATEKLSRISIQDSPPGFWKKEYIRKCTSSGTRGVGLLLKSINRYTGLPSKLREAVKALGITWMIALCERTGKEHVYEQGKACFSDTSATVCWNGAVWPPLCGLKTLCVYGITPLFPPSKTAGMHGPRRRSLLVEYDLTTLEESSTFIGCDKLIKLRCLYPGLLLGCWQEDGELAVIVANLHFHQLIEKSTLGSVSCPYMPPSHDPVADDVVSEYGLLGYHCHIALHNGRSSCMSGSFHNLYCRKESVQNGFLQIMIISLENESQHSTISGSIYIPWNTEFLKGKIQHCCLMDVTVLDETEKPFWCISSPVALQSTSTPDIRFSYLGQRQTIEYKDHEGKVHMELIWLEEQQQYFIVSLVLYLNVRKVNAWFSTSY